MPLREFTDESGREWRVWDVQPESLHPTTRAEDYLRDYLEGWLTFETVDGTAKRRIHPIPRGWDAASTDGLRALLGAAEQVIGGRSSGPHGLTAAEQAANPLSAAPARATQRTFRFPGGRYWSVGEWTVTDPSGREKSVRVLRFTSGSRSLQLEDFPRDWDTLTDDQLAELIARGFPRETRPNLSEHHRRATDRLER